MELANILSQLKDIGSTGMSKTAAAKETPKSDSKEASAKDELLKALDGALNKQGSTKTASSSPSASAELVKMASDLAAAEQEGITKQAHLYGAAVADGFVARLQQTGAVATKIATQQGTDEDGFNKFASENPELVKQAMELGYNDGVKQIQMMKQAATNDAFQRGYADTTAELQKLASTADGQDKIASFKQGYNETVDKVASYNKGYEDTVNETVKIASDCATRGYNDTVNVLRSL
jgi:hypothetical protein